MTWNLQHGTRLVLQREKAKTLQGTHSSNCFENNCPLQRVYFCAWHTRSLNFQWFNLYEDWWFSALCFLLWLRGKVNHCVNAEMMGGWTIKVSLHICSKKRNLEDSEGKGSKHGTIWEATSNWKADTFYFPRKVVQSPTTDRTGNIISPLYFLENNIILLCTT